jgi:hypothetical protein
MIWWQVNDDDEQTRTNIHALSGLRTHGPNDQGLHLRPRGHLDRREVMMISAYCNISYKSSVFKFLLFLTHTDVFFSPQHKGEEQESNGLSITNHLPLQTGKEDWMWYVWNDSVRTRTCNVLLHTREQFRRGDSRMQSAISNAWPSLTEHCSQHKRPQHSKHLVVVRLLQAISSLAASQRQRHAIHLQMRQFVRFLLD